jgi:serine protease Do
MLFGRDTLLFALPLAVLVGCATPVVQAEPTLWKESTTTSPALAPELARFNDLLTDLAERMKPALVQLRVNRAVETREREEGRTPDEPRRASGSGFLITQNGLLVTNAHVIENAKSIQVRLADGRRFAGEVVGKDIGVDLAIIKIKATELPVLPLGDSNRLRVGEFVLALGHPFGLEQTVSFGIVSRKGPSLSVAARGVDYILTDAAINPGNSGGPLINMAGEVVGVNSMAARGGSIGFAIPSNLVKLLTPQLVAKGKVEWGYLGVAIAEVADEDLDKFKLKEPRGVLIREVVSGQPADKGGMKVNDIVVSIDGNRTDAPRDLQRIVSSSPVGRRVRVSVLRDGKPEDLDVVIGPYQPREDR